MALQLCLRERWELESDWICSIFSSQEAQNAHCRQKDRLQSHRGNTRPWTCPKLFCMDSSGQWCKVQCALGMSISSLAYHLNWHSIFRPLGLLFCLLRCASELVASESFSSFWWLATWLQDCQTDDSRKLRVCQQRQGLSSFKFLSFETGSTWMVDHELLFHLWSIFKVCLACQKAKTGQAQALSTTEWALHLIHLLLAFESFSKSTVAWLESCWDRFY